MASKFASLSSLMSSGRDGSSAPNVPSTARDGLGSSLLASLPSTSDHALVNPALAAEATPALSDRLHALLASLAESTATDAPALSSRVRDCQELVTEVVSRWRRSTTLALDSITKLEDDVARRDADLEAARADARAVSTDLQTTKATLVQVREEAFSAKRAHDKLLRQMTKPNVAHVSPSHAPPTPELVSELRRVVRDGPDSDSYQHFFDKLDDSVAGSPSPGAAPRSPPPPPPPVFSAATAVGNSSFGSPHAGAASGAAVTPGRRSPSVRSGGGGSGRSPVSKPRSVSHGSQSGRSRGTRATSGTGGGRSSRPSVAFGSAPRHYDTTLRDRARRETKARPLSPSQQATLRHSVSATTATKAARLSPSHRRRPPSDTPVMFDLTFNAAQHAASTVADLRTAVHSMSGKWPTKMSVAGVELDNGALSLAAAGVGLACSLEIYFGDVSTSRAAAAAAAAVASDGGAGPASLGPSDNPVQASSKAQRLLAIQSSSGIRMRGGLYHAAMRDSSNQRRRENLLHDLFHTIDTDRNNFVDRVELTRFIEWTRDTDDSDPVHRRMCALLCEEGALQRAFAACDLNKDNKLNWPEFKLVAEHAILGEDEADAGPPPELHPFSVASSSQRRKPSASSSPRKSRGGRVSAKARMAVLEAEAQMAVPYPTGIRRRAHGAVETLMGESADTVTVPPPTKPGPVQAVTKARRIQTIRAVQAAKPKAQLRGGLFHNALRNPLAATRRREILRSLFDDIDADDSGFVDRPELFDFVRWATSNPRAKPLHQRFCQVILEEGSLTEAWKRADQNDDCRLSWDEFRIMGEHALLGFGVVPIPPDRKTSSKRARTLDPSKAAQLGKSAAQLGREEEAGVQRTLGKGRVVGVEVSGFGSGSDRGGPDRIVASSVVAAPAASAGRADDADGAATDSSAGAGSHARADVTPTRVPGKRFVAPPVSASRGSVTAPPPLHTPAAAAAAASAASPASLLVAMRPAAAAPPPPPASVVVVPDPQPRVPVPGSATHAPGGRRG